MIESKKMRQKIEKALKAIWICSWTDKEEFSQKSSFKEKIKRIPVFGKVMWIIYGILKAPERISHLFSEIESLKFQLKVQEESFQERISRLFSEIESLKLQLKVQEESLQKVEEIDRKLDHLYEDLSFRYKEIPENAVIEVKNLKEEVLDNEEKLYERFEERFRGEIKERLRKYVPFVKEVWERKKKEGRFFLDIGFGRGEFLEILREERIPVKGVEKSSLYVRRLQEKGFEVICTDAIEYLRKLDKDLIFGVSAIQVIEHLDYPELKKLLSVIYEKLIPGGIIILETVNPKSSIALSNFYIDFTHIRPYPHELVTFLCSCSGFRSIKIIFSSPVERNFRTGVLEADYMDYALIAYKPEL